MGKFLWGRWQWWWEVNDNIDNEGDENNEMLSMVIGHRLKDGTRVNYRTSYYSTREQQLAELMALTRK